MQPPQTDLAATAVAPADLIEALMAIPQAGNPSASGGGGGSQYGQRFSRGLSRRKSKARQVLQKGTKSFSLCLL